MCIRDRPHAELIYRNRHTLESYLDSLETGVYYTFDGYGFTLQEPDEEGNPVSYTHLGVFRRGKNRGRQHPAAAYEDRGGSFQSPIYPDGMGHGL